ncbi:MAG: hypothetical protein ACERKX_06070 [Anaerolineales bacterium]
MKNKYWLSLLILGTLVVSLAACSSENPEGASESASDVSASEEIVDTSKDVGASAEGTGGERPPLPQVALIPIGTMMLEDTEFAVSADQAAELLPLWKMYRSLVESDTAASLEIDAVLGQIENAMTVDQLQAISEMELTPENMQDMMEELGLAPEGTRNDDGITEGFTRPGGGIGGGPGGGGPGGGSGGNFGGDLTQEQIATLQAQREEFGGGQNRFSVAFVEALIELLETK